MLKTYTRRKFLSYSSLATATLWLELIPNPFSKQAAMQTVTNPSLPALHNSTFAEATANSLSRDRSQNIRSLQTLGYIFRRTMEPGRNDLERQATLNDLRQLALTGRGFDPATFNGMTVVMTGGDPDWQSHASAYSRNISKLLNVFGAGVGVINPGVGAGLQIAGTVAEDTLTYLAQPNLNLSFLPQTRRDQLAVINSMAFAKALELYKEVNSFKTSADDLAIKSQLNVGFTSNDPALFQQLPDRVKEIVRVAVNQGIEGIRGNASRTSQLLQDLSNEVSAGFDDLNEQTFEIRRMMHDEKLASENAQRLQQVRADFEYSKREIAGAITVGTVILSEIIGNQEAAAKWSGTATALQNIYSATALYAMGGIIGPLALVGTYAGAVMVLVSLFSPSSSSGPTIELQTLKAVERLADKIQELRADVTFRFAQIEERQIQILNLLDQILSQVRRGNYEIANLLLEVKERIDGLSARLMAAQRQEKRSAFELVVTATKGVLANTSISKSSEAFKLDFTRNTLSNFYNYAMEKSKEIAFAGDTENPCTYDLIRKQISERRQAELLFGLVPAMGNLVGARVDVSNSSNPLEWSYGAQAYLESKALVPEVSTSATADEIKNLWKRGLEVREVARVAGSIEGVKKASHNYLLSTGAKRSGGGSQYRTVADMLGQYLEEITREAKLFKYEQIETVGVSYFSNEFFQLGGPVFYLKGPFVVLRLRQDPIELAETAGIIQKITTYTKTGVSNFGMANLPNDVAYVHSDFDIVIKKGPDEGARCGTLSFEHFRRPGTPGISFYTWQPKSGTIPPRLTGSNDSLTTEKLIPYLTELLVRYYNYDQLKQNGGAWFAQKLLKENSLSTPTEQGIQPVFEGSASILRLFSTISNWRLSRRSDVKYQTDINNILGLFTPADVAHLLDNFFKKDYPRDIDWSNAIKDAFISSVRNDVVKLKRRAKDVHDEEGILEVDETLRRLGGYMRAHKITFPQPSLPPGRGLSFPVSADLVSWWAGENDLQDAVSSNHGSRANEVGFVAGRVGLAFSFDGDDDGIKIPHNPNLSPYDSFAVVAWIKANSQQVKDRFSVVDKSDGPNFTGWNLQGDRSSGALKFSLGTGRSFVSVDSGITVLDDRWHHVAGVYAGNEILVYVDGILRNSVNLDGRTAADNLGELYIGRSSGSNGGNFRGFVDNLGIYDQFLTKDEVKVVMQYRP